MERKTVIKRALALAENRIRMGRYALTEQETMMTNGSWEAGFVEAVLLFLNEQNEHLLKEVHEVGLTKEQINTLVEGLNLEKEIKQDQDVIQKIAKENNEKAEEYYQKLREGNKKAIETLYSRLHETQVQSKGSSILRR